MTADIASTNGNDSVRSAIVTGSAGGIGAAEVARFISAGYYVIANDIDAARLANTVEQLGGAAVVTGVPGDISSSDTARALVAEATRDGRRLETVINNAGAIRNGPIHELSDDDFDHVVATNLRGTFMLSREASKYWRRNAVDTGRAMRSNLINTTSRAALLANPAQSNYGAAKAGVAVMTQILARELRTYGTRCNVIAPRAYTPMMREGLGEFRQDALEEWSPDYIARFAEFLSSPTAAGITGQIFVVHGWHVQLARTWDVSDSVDLDYSGGQGRVLAQLDGLFAGEPMEISEFEADDFPLADSTAANPFKLANLKASAE
ncbi:SDR family NAD(P)-dependent oxidoreductase [Arthrobacter sp. EPSL27]|uniref:SDR family NAD(P)-dependent oxidoreductase n=1 Tax=Arthrobacter sp. EPSL27 TaxID=1745378 RepID=UPI000747F0F6|nr:SDR family NAD(P)-dependent oxidoreductase [Arthrobacter sp. EPSL27]KUM37402.1 hypothetical protein AR539_09060 [Arthrobacter sp. EPSL27]